MLSLTGVFSTPSRLRVQNVSRQLSDELTVNHCHLVNGNLMIGLKSARLSDRSFAQRVQGSEPLAP